MNDVLLSRKHHVARTKEITSFSTFYIDFVFKTSLGTHILLAKDADGDQKMLQSGCKHPITASAYESPLLWIKPRRAHPSLCNSLCNP